MERHDEIIWKYLDGDCNEAELSTFNGLMSDPDFENYFRSVERIHLEIKKSVPLEVSESLTDTIMHVVLRSVPRKAADYRKGLFVILGSTFILSLGAVFLSVFYPSTNISSVSEKFIEEYGNWLSIDPNSSFFSVLPYLSVLLGICLLIWIDKVIVQRFSFSGK